MPDFRIRVFVRAEVDGGGDALVVRRWEVSNLTQRSLDFSNFRFSVTVTSRDLAIKDLAASPHCECGYSTSRVGIGETRIDCDFDQILAPGGMFHLDLTYQHPRYLREIRRDRQWVLAEYFGRVPLDDLEYTQEEPQVLEFSLAVNDPRPQYLGVRSPFRRWHIDASEQCTFRQEGLRRLIVYTRGLYSEDRLPDLHVVSTVDDRSLFMTSAGVASSATAAVVIERLLSSLF